MIAINVGNKCISWFRSADETEKNRCQCVAQRIKTGFCTDSARVSVMYECCRLLASENEVAWRWEEKPACLKSGGSLVFSIKPTSCRSWRFGKLDFSSIFLLLLLLIKYQQCRAFLTLALPLVHAWRNRGLVKWSDFLTTAQEDYRKPPCAIDVGVKTRFQSSHCQKALNH